MEREGGHANGIDGEHEEARIIRQQLPGKINQFRQIAFQLPNFAIGAAAIFGRIKDQAVIFCPAPHLAAKEFQRIIDDPAHRRIAQARQRGILAGGRHAFLAGINVRHLRTGPRCNQAADAGIAKHVQHPIAGLDAAGQPIELGAHVGKEAEVTEGCVVGPETDLSSRRWALHGPAFGHIGRKLPAATAVFIAAADELAIGLPVGAGGRPHCLRFRADEAEAAIAFQLAAVAGVHQPEISPRFGNEGGKCGHQAATLWRPISARAGAALSMAAPAARAASTVTASMRATSSAGGTKRPCTIRLRPR